MAEILPIRRKTLFNLHLQSTIYNIHVPTIFKSNYFPQIVAILVTYLKVSDV